VSERQAEPTTGSDDVAPEATTEPPREPDWWHRDHPTFAALTGFFTGLLFIILVPGVFAGLLHALVDDSTAEDLFPFVLVTLAVPLALVIVPKSRRFGRYMWLGMVLTLIVVGGVAALVLWYLFTHQD
jgi:amino acid transporter